MAQIHVSFISSPYSMTQCLFSAHAHFPMLHVTPFSGCDYFSGCGFLNTSLEKANQQPPIKDACMNILIIRCTYLKKHFEGITPESPFHH